MENKLKVFTLIDNARKLRHDIRYLDEGFIVERNIKCRPDNRLWIFPQVYYISCTQVHSKESPSERVATIFESKRKEGLRHVAVIARGDTELPEAVSIAYSLGLIPERKYEDFLSG